jgi:hypothetical protein
MKYKRFIPLFAFVFRVIYFLVPFMIGVAPFAAYELTLRCRKKRDPQLAEARAISKMDVPPVR